MSAPATAPLAEVRLAQGTVRYRELGSGRPVLLVHGLLNNSLLWEEVAEILAAEFRVIAPDWPLGGHSVALDPGADLRPPALARMIGELAEALGLEDAILVGNDTGGALCQLVAVERPEWLGALVLTPCDSYRDFLPLMFRPLQLLARLPGSARLIVNSVRPRLVQRTPMAFGWLSRRPLPRRMAQSFLRGAQRDRGVRRDLSAFLAGIDNRHTLAAAERFHEFDRPVLLAWAPEDHFFKLRNAERMAASFPNCRLELIENSLTYVSIDQPRRTAELIASVDRR